MVATEPLVTVGVTVVVTPAALVTVAEVSETKEKRSFAVVPTGGIGAGRKSFTITVVASEVPLLGILMV